MNFYSLFFLIYFLNIFFLFGYFLSKNKFFLLISYFLLLYLFSKNVYNSDYNSYLILYKNDLSIEFGFKFLINFFNYFNFSYDFFRLIVFGLSLALYLKSFFYFFGSKGVFLFFLIYPISLMLLDFIQIRNFLMASLFLFSLTLLGKRKNIIWITVIFSLSFSIHYASIIYLPFYLFNYLFKDKNDKYLIFSIPYFLFITILIYFFQKYFYRYIEIPDLLIQTNLGAYLYFSLQFLFSYYIYVEHNKLNKKIYSKNKIKIISSLTIYLLYITPLYHFNISYFRLSRNYLVLILVYYIISYLSNRKYKKYLGKLLPALLFFGFIFYFELLRQLIDNIYPFL